MRHAVDVEPESVWTLVRWEPEEGDDPIHVDEQDGFVAGVRGFH
jgi:hypothetical protein